MPAWAIARPTFGQLTGDFNATLSHAPPQLLVTWGLGSWLAFVVLIAGGETRMVAGRRLLAIVGHWRGECSRPARGRLLIEGGRASATD
jgi:hypothetical protein